MFGQRKHKTFEYKPRFSKNGDGARIEETQPEFVSKWKRANTSNTKKVKGLFSMRFLILALVLLLICMYLLEKKCM